MDNYNNESWNNNQNPQQNQNTYSAQDYQQPYGSQNYSAQDYQRPYGTDNNQNYQNSYGTGYNQTPSYQQPNYNNMSNDEEHVSVLHWIGIFCLNMTISISITLPSSLSQKLMLILLAIDDILLFSLVFFPMYFLSIYAYPCHALLACHISICSILASKMVIL